MKPYHFLILWTTLLYLSCQSVPPAPDENTLESATAKTEAFYSDAHLDYAKWNRTSECCTATGKVIAIASGGTYSSRAGLEVYNEGGNVVDASVAVAFTLAVERPHSLGLGGGGFLTLHLAEHGRQYFIDFRETAPRRAYEKMYQDKSGNIIKGLSTEGALAVGTPGFVAGLIEVHRRWGRLPLWRVLDPAVRLARLGFPIYPSLAEKIAARIDRFSKDPYLKKLFFSKKGEILKTGDLLIQTDLGNLIEKIGKEGRKAFYDGANASKITQFVKSRGGLLDAADLKAYEPKFREPVKGNFRGHTLVSAPPPSAGGIFIVQMLNILDGLPLDKEVLQTDRYVHLLSEVMKRAYADRSQFVGDPDFYDKDVRFLTSREYADAVRAQIRWERATPSKEIIPGAVAPKEQKGTTHFSIIDREGNAASGTLTINDSFGAQLAVPGTGVFLNNEMDDFSSKPGEPNIYGLTGGVANSIQPGKRPVSSMSPTLVFQGDIPVMAVGGAGGSRIISSVLQTILNNLVVYPGDLKKAVFAPRMHHQWIPDRLDLEKGFPDAAIEALKQKNHEIASWPFSAQVQAVYRTPDGKFVAVFDPRDEGGAAAE